jgi:DNA-binding NtrC family response regulator
MRHLIATDAQPTAASGAPGARTAPASSRAGHDDFAFAGIVGESRTVRSTIDYVRRLAQSAQDGPSTVLMVGPAGTGKSLFARALHYAGDRAHLPFLVLDCRTTPHAMLEAQASARPACSRWPARARCSSRTSRACRSACSPKLLRALAERRVRRVGGREEFAVACTVVVSAARPIEELVAECVFRDDLYSRLNETRISLPSLRERGDDVILLAERFCASMACCP